MYSPKLKSYLLLIFGKHFILTIYLLKRHPFLPPHLRCWWENDFEKLLLNTNGIIPLQLQLIALAWKYLSYYQVWRPGSTTCACSIWCLESIPGILFTKAWQQINFDEIYLLSIWTACSFPHFAPTPQYVIALRLRIEIQCLKGEVRRFFFICSKFLLAQN